MGPYVLLGAIALGAVVWQLFATYLHGRALERHNEEMRKIYEKYR